MRSAEISEPAKDVATQVSGSPPQTSSCASPGIMPSSQPWQASRPATQALDGQARASSIDISVWMPKGSSSPPKPRGCITR